jgi:hypothetical protein
MFLSTECFHSFHIPCFKEYAKKRLVMGKKTMGDIVFEDALCGRCNKAVTFEEIKEMMTREELS